MVFRLEVDTKNEDESLFVILCSLILRGFPEELPKGFPHSDKYDKFFHKENQHILVETSPCQKAACYH